MPSRRSAQFNVVTIATVPKSDWLCSLQPKMVKLYTVSKNKTRSWLWLRSWTPIAKFRLKLKKVGKTTRPFKYDLHQIPYDYTVKQTAALHAQSQATCSGAHVESIVLTFSQLHTLCSKPSSEQSLLDTGPPTTATCTHLHNTLLTRRNEPPKEIQKNRRTKTKMSKRTKYLRNNRGIRLLK